MRTWEAGSLGMSYKDTAGAGGREEGFLSCLFSPTVVQPLLGDGLPNVVHCPLGKVAEDGVSMSESVGGGTLSVIPVAQTLFSLDPGRQGGAHGGKRVLSSQWGAASVALTLPTEVAPSYWHGLPLTQN